MALVIGGAPAWCQEATGKEEIPHPHGFEFGFYTGPLLPKRIPNVTEILPAWGMRPSFDTAMGRIEIETLHAISEGVRYHGISSDLRMDVWNNLLPVHVNLGLHMDYIMGAGQSQYKTAGGWHYGGGIQYPMLDPLWFRFDFKYKFSPGQSLLVEVGMVWHFPAAEKN